jgi:Mg/Co/Ni transporter MgtE
MSIIYVRCIMNMKNDNKTVNEKIRREFVAGFTAGAVCLGAVALVLLVIFFL